MDGSGGNPSNGWSGALTPPLNHSLAPASSDQSDTVEGGWSFQNWDPHRRGQGASAPGIATCKPIVETKTRRTDTQFGSVGKDLSREERCNVIGCDRQVCGAEMRVLSIARSVESRLSRYRIFFSRSLCWQLQSVRPF